ncbi:AmmeMemoRadiSam system protein A [Petrocella sp. FN5]|uniref:AmmeMemoRadiSam system protein A n=1 Tax=Petrocella sp. FN5 TaxID=3032002 RepID=UPI0023D988A9|nr:AmmeMemoRadiSam system protein A [Petrocella sp. FN5]MDF1617804.1 AmmeMemoRadiSam system protein A [Petrocella sp. FN5]
MQSIEVFFLPHPPIAIPEVGQGRERIMGKTLEGYRWVAQKIKKIKPETIVMITPHGHSFSNGICMLGTPYVHGDLKSFGVSDVAMSKKINLPLTHLIQMAWEENDLVSLVLDKEMEKSYGTQVKIDHGALVPLYFVDEVYDGYQLVHVTPCGMSALDHYNYGVTMKDVIRCFNESIVVICSGDLSHALTDDGPYTYNPYGKTFDALVVKAIENKSPEILLNLSPKDISDAAQCGLNSFLMGFGIMDGYDYHSEVKSYEGPFGVGYLTGYLVNDFTTLGKSKRVQLSEEAMKAYEDRKKSEDGFVKIARGTIEEYVKTGKKISREAVTAYVDGDTIHELMNQKSGIFVSIHKEGSLRGCIGTIEPVFEDLIEEIIHNAISACSSDPRFNPIEAWELMTLEIKVDRLYPPEKIVSKEDLDVEKYGVIVEDGYKRGLLLPNLEGIETVDQQVEIAKKKAGIIKKDGFTLYRFEVERHI